MEKIEYCPRCDKYLTDRSTYPGMWFCPFCCTETVLLSTWNAWSDNRKGRFFSEHTKPSRQMDDPESIEFATKFDAEYREHLAEEKYRKEHPVIYTPKCPTCGCPDLDKIGAGEKVASAAMFGLFSRKINKQFRCKNCGYEW